MHGKDIPIPGSTRISSTVRLPGILLLRESEMLKESLRKNLAAEIKKNPKCFWKYVRSNL